MAKKIWLIFKTREGEETIALPLIHWIWDTGKGTRIQHITTEGLKEIECIEPFFRVRARINKAKDIQNGTIPVR
jgi:hypothetical protein